MKPIERSLVQTLLVIAALLGVSAMASAQSLVNRNDGALDLEFVAETGFVKVFAHRIQIGDPGDELDYVNEGGQEILFPFSRVTAELIINDRHTVIFLYQPLEIATVVKFEESRTIDGVVFDAGQTVDLLYGFPFYRASYLYDFAAADNLELAAGLSVQIRNATLRFESIDDTTGDIESAISQDLGPVPIIKVRGEYRFPGTTVPGGFVGLEADGFYASSAFFNGASFEFSGSIFDASLRAGFAPAPGLEVFVNLRALGGGARGTRPDDSRQFWSQSTNGFTDNFLVTSSLTLGARLK